MNLPKQVQEQFEQSERLMQQMMDGENTETPEVETPAEPESPAEEQTPEPEQAPEPTPDPEPETPAEPTSEIDWQARALKAEQKYSVLQGKYNSEIAELKKQDRSGEIADLQATIQELRSTITDLKQQSDEPQPQSELVNPELEQLREDYGPDLIDGLLAAAKQQVMGEVSGQVKQVQQHVQQDSFSTKKAVLAQKLAGQHIDFEQVNNDPLFHTWLSKFDPETGIQRQAALTQTFEAGQLDATAALFLEYVQGGSTTPQQQTPFEQHVQPPSKAPAQENTPAPIPSFTNAQIAQFYDDWARGKLTPEQAHRMEEQILQFTSQGAR